VEKIFEETSCGDLRSVQYRKSDMDFQTVLNSLANSSGFLNYAMEDCSSVSEGSCFTHDKSIPTPDSEFPADSCVKRLLPFTMESTGK
jgi:hypothetical protein